MENLIQVKNLIHIYSDNGSGKKYGIKDVTFSVEKGEFIILAGKNGSGKTTLLRHLNGLLLPTSGEVLISGINIQKNIVEIRKKVGMVFQDADSQIVGETVFDEVAFGLENLKFPRKLINEKVESTLELLSLIQLADRNPATLSGGEKRKLAIAGILVMEPDVILFDEPFSNLDYPGASNLLSLITRLNKNGITIIIATHEIEKVIDRATRMVIMDNGHIKKDGTPAELVKITEQYGIREPCSSKLNLGIMSWIN
ncbi:MAG: energy-coupling factor ABC transporter ATP-binding protein [Desulfobacteraceae bacterium]|nr:energy-coupling factor ABC transporter ATP-binding protein [Desulfobacteraceae bacterium]